VWLSNYCKCRPKSKHSILNHVCSNKIGDKISKNVDVTEMQHKLASNAKSERIAADIQKT